MGKIVPLPDNASRHVEIGKQALANQNYASAAAHLDKAFAEAPTYVVARLLVPALNALHQEQAALPYLSRFMADFVADPAGSAVVFDTLLALPDYRFAWAVLPHLPEAQQAAMKTRVIDAEVADRTAHGPAITELAKRLRHLGGFAPHEQEELINSLGRLPRRELIAAASGNLVDPDVHPAVRISLLDALTAIGATEPVTILGYTGEQTVVPNALPGVMNDPTIAEVLHEVAVAAGDNDPELARATGEVLKFELGYLYPVIGDVIGDPATFAQAYLHKDAATVTPTQRDLFAWLSAQTAKLMEMA